MEINVHPTLKDYIKTLSDKMLYELFEDVVDEINRRKELQKSIISK